MTWSLLLSDLYNLNANYSAVQDNNYDVWIHLDPKLLQIQFS